MRILKVGDSAEVVQNALNALSNIGGAGGSVTVTRSTDGTKYNVLFGGSTWFRPPFISVEGRPGAFVKGVSQVAITKQNKDSSLPISLSNNIQLSVPDAISFPIDNAPSFTPTNLLRKDGSIRLLGYLEAPGIGGRFYPAGEGRSYDDANVEIGSPQIGSPGFRIRGVDWAYTLNPVTDSRGNSRPITLLESIGYRNSRYNPVAGERTVSFQLLSGSTLSNASLALISVEPDIVPPQVTIGASSSSFTEDGSAVAIAANFTLTAKDATSPFLSAPEVLYGAEVDIVNYVDGEDVLNFTSTGKIVGDFNPIEGRNYLTGEASFDEYEAAIRSVTYLNTSDVPTTIARQISIRLLDSGENGLANQAVTTQVVIGVADSVSLSSGTAEDIHVLQNDEPVSLGLDDLVFSSGELSTGELELRFTATELPDDTLGRILLADGTALEHNTPHTIGELAGLRFEPEIGGLGSDNFSYSVAVADPDTGNMDSAVFTDTLVISVDGIATTTPSQAFVSQAYRDLLGRNPDQATLTNLANQLDQKLKRVGRSTNGFSNEMLARRSLLVEITSSPSYRTERLNELYLSLPIRQASSLEVAQGLAKFAAGGSVEEVKLSILTSDEYLGLHDDGG